MTCLNRNGVALSAEEIVESPRYAGNLVIDDWHQGGRFGRFIRQAWLLDMTIPSTPWDIIPPIFALQLLGMAGSQLLLHQRDGESKQLRDTASTLEQSLNVRLLEIE